MLTTVDGQEAVYYPQVFNVHSLEYAKSIILRQTGCSVDDRWARETPYLVDKIIEQYDLRPESVVLDYGCGIGRVAKELISATGCFVIGVDISATMRSFADYYVDSDRFFVCAPSALKLLPKVADLTISIWVLQHAEKPTDDLCRIKGSLKSDGKLFLINQTGRALPVKIGDEYFFRDDQLDIKAIIKAADFHELSSWKISSSVCTEIIANASFGALYQSGSDRRGGG